MPGPSRCQGWAVSKPRARAGPSKLRFGRRDLLPVHLPRTGPPLGSSGHMAATEPTKQAHTASRDHMAPGRCRSSCGALVLLDSHKCYASTRNVAALMERFASLSLGLIGIFQGWRGHFKVESMPHLHCLGCWPELSCDLAQPSKPSMSVQGAP